MDALLIVINILLILVALILIVCVLMQEGNRAGLGAIGGGAETFFGKAKAKGVQGKLQLITKIGAVVFIVLAILATGLTARKNSIANIDTPLEQIDALATVEPTAEPATDPTVEPTTEPTAVPTVEPTAEPTAVPTVVPTAVPTVVPTAVPTAEPAAAPAVQATPAA